MGILVNTTSVTSAIACIAAGFFLSKAPAAHADNVAFDAYPAPMFVVEGIADSTITLQAIKGNDGLIHHVIAGDNDGHCTGHAAEFLSNSRINVGSVNIEVTQSCSTRGTLYLTPASYAAEQALQSQISATSFFNVWGGAVGRMQTFDVSAYHDTMRFIGEKD